MSGEKSVPIEAVAARRHHLSGTLQKQQKLLTGDYEKARGLRLYIRTSYAPMMATAELRNLQGRVRAKEKKIPVIQAQLREVDATIVNHAGDLRDSLIEREKQLVTLFELRRNGKLAPNKARMSQLWWRWRKDSSLRREIPGLQETLREREASAVREREVMPARYHEEPAIPPLISSGVVVQGAALSEGSPTSNVSADFTRKLEVSHNRGGKAGGEKRSGSETLPGRSATKRDNERQTHPEVKPKEIRDKIEKITDLLEPCKLDQGETLLSLRSMLPTNISKALDDQIVERFISQGYVTQPDDRGIFGPDAVTILLCLVSSWEGKTLSQDQQRGIHVLVDDIATEKRESKAQELPVAADSQSVEDINEGDETVVVRGYRRVAVKA